MPRPGGTINDLNVVMQHDALLPLRLNNPRTQVWREPVDGDRADRKRWTLVKDIDIVLSDDDPRLDFPTVTLQSIEVELGGQKVSDFDHADIIQVDERLDDRNSDRDDSDRDLVG